MLYDLAVLAGSTMLALLVGAGFLSLAAFFICLFTLALLI